MVKGIREKAAWILYGLVVLLGWVWQLFVAQYRYELIENGASEKQLFFATSMLALIATVWLGVLLMRQAGKGRRSALFSLIPLGIVNFVAISGLLMTLNGALDRQPALAYQTTVIDAYSQQRGRQSRYWVVVEEAWGAGDRKYQLYLPRAQFVALDAKPGDAMTIEIGPGALSWPWIRSVTNDG